MKRKNLKMVASAALALTMLVQVGAPVYAESIETTAETSWKSDVKDHWNFDSNISDQGNRSTGVLHDITIEETGNSVFGKALKFGTGTDKYMSLENYINTGTGQTSFSMWYKYDTSITETNTNASAVLLQHEDKGNRSGRTLLSLKADGKYDTFINGERAAVTEKAVQKGDWQHITVVFDQEAKTVKYYINGELDSTAKTIGNSATDEVLTLRVGSHKSAGSTDSHPMRGFIDELYVYDRALSDNEAKSLYEEKATELYKVDLNVLITEAEKLLGSGSLPEENELHVKLQEAISAAKEAASAGTPVMETLKSAKDILTKAMENYKANQPIGLKINTEEVTQHIDSKSIFGINHRYAFNGYGTFDSKNMKMKDEFVELYKDAGFGSIRYPGGTISNLFNWKTTLGPKEQRKKQIHGFYNNQGQGELLPILVLERLQPLQMK